MHYFFIEEKNSKIIFSISDIHHITKVLRKKINSILYCINQQKNFLVKVKIISIDPFLVEIIDKNKVHNINNSHINIFVGVIKKHNFESLIRFLNEINAKSLTPILFERSQRNIIYDKNRINNILRESSKQSNRINPIIVNQVMNYIDFLTLIKNGQNYFANVEEKIISFAKLNCKIKEDVNLIIGPEGGFTQMEINDISQMSSSISLGPNILRSETAAIYIASIFVEKENKNEKQDF